MGIKGSILGDIAGSYYEYTSNRPSAQDSYNLFDEKKCYFTDDTVMAIAAMEACNNKNNFIHCFQELGRTYPDAGYGAKFGGWIYNKNPKGGI